MPLSHILENLNKLAEQRPHESIFGMVNGDGHIEKEITRQGFNSEVEALSFYLKEKIKLIKGDRVILIYPPSLEFIFSFTSCLQLGVIPIPVYPFNPFNPEEGLNKIDSIINISQAKAILTSKGFSWVIKAGKAKHVFKKIKWPKLDWIVTDKFTVKGRVSLDNLTRLKDDLAFLQFTSGSTGNPKGVCITHQNLIHQLTFNAEALDFSPHSRFVMWVPQYHDLGLISGILSILIGNGRLWIIPPQDFLKRPAVWAEVMHRVKATHTASPNFGFELTAKKTQDDAVSKWDLSSLKVVMSAAEPIIPATVDRFFKKMAPAGLKKDSFTPAYGLAEHTVGITIGGKGRIKVNRKKMITEKKVLIDEDSNLEIFNSGSCPSDIKCLIYEASTGSVLPPGNIGEIVVQSKSVANGYFGLEQSSRESFELKIAGHSGNFLRTGDEGFFYHDELYVSGRIKDLIIIRGKNYYPEDVEEVVRHSDSRINKGKVAAFSVPDESTEKLMVLLELRDENADVESVAQNVQKHISLNFYINSTILIGEKGSVSKTTSGKVQRAKCRENFLKNELKTQKMEGKQSDSLAKEKLSKRKTGNDILDEINASPPEIRIELFAQWLTTLVKQNIDYYDGQEITIKTFLPSVGLDSLASVGAITEMSDELGIEIDTSLFFNYPTADSAAKKILEILNIDFEFVVEEPSRREGNLDDQFPGDKESEIFIRGNSIKVVLEALRLKELGYKCVSLEMSEEEIETGLGIHILDNGARVLGRSLVIYDNDLALIDFFKKLDVKVEKYSAPLEWWDEKYGLELAPGAGPAQRIVKRLLTEYRRQSKRYKGYTFLKFYNELEGASINPIIQYHYLRQGFGKCFNIQIERGITFLESIENVQTIARVSGNPITLRKAVLDYLNEVEIHLNNKGNPDTFIVDMSAGINRPKSVLIPKEDNQALFQERVFLPNNSEFFEVCLINSFYEVFFVDSVTDIDLKFLTSD